MLILGKFICQNLYFRSSSSDGSTDLILRAILEELVDAFGFEKNSILSKIICALLIQLAKKFAIQLIDFDREVGKSGLLEAARKALPNYIRTLSVTGADSVPPRGPLLVLANHPGLSDALCLIAAIQRLDLRVIALERPLLRALPNASKYLFFVDSSPAKRMTAVRQVVAHLKGGGAVLIFPAGKIEPDPDVYDGAEQSLANWSDSVSLFLRLVPETQVVPALVRGRVVGKGGQASDHDPEAGPGRARTAGRRPAADLSAPVRCASRGCQGGIRLRHPPPGPRRLPPRRSARCCLGVHAPTLATTKINWEAR
jgi:hypothetical protein